MVAEVVAIGSFMGFFESASVGLDCISLKVDGKNCYDVVGQDP